MEKCESCGMPMIKDEDHGGKDPNNKRCLHCSHPDGTHKTREEVKEGMINWMLSDEIEKEGHPKAKSREEAEKRAEAVMIMNPAWSE